jgi:photosystem II stability/assembly factor-like uncharacterized protein
MKRWLPEFLVICAIFMVVGYGFAQTWTQVQLGRRPPVTSVALSADGERLVAIASDQAIISTNACATTQFVSQPYQEVLIASSADANTLVGIKTVGAYVCISTNMGITWALTSLPQSVWRSCTSSADGTKLVAAIYDGLIYTSTNTGTTWQTNSTLVKNWSCLASSADGTKLAAGASGDKIYTSTNAGLSWTAPFNCPVNSWNAIASSADGTHLVATCSSGTYISSNSGGIWTTSKIGGVSAASSADGSKLIICANTANVCISTNFGISWVTNIFLNQTCSSAALSADGDELVVGASGGGGLWVASSILSPRLILAQTNGSLALSWLIPSTNFVVQQSPDLISWSSITDQPALNLTNLNYEMNFAPSNAGGFFRLVSQ